MSTIKATTLSNLAGSKTVPTDTVVDGSAKAWVNFNGTGTVAIRRAFNVSSITDIATGVYTINLTNAMPDLNYAILGSANGDAIRAANIYENTSSGRSGLSTTAIPIAVYDSLSAIVDRSSVSFAILS